MNITEQELTELFLKIKQNCISEIEERNSDDEYTIEEKQWNEQHWRGVSIGGEVLYKNILDTIKYKNLAEEN